MTIIDREPEAPGRSIGATIPFVLIIVLIVVGSILCALSLVPQWRSYEELSSVLAEQRLAVVATLTQSAIEQQDDLAVVQLQHDSAQETLTAAGSLFWTDIQVNAIIDRLYQYAAESEVVLSVLQNQANTRTSRSDYFVVRALQLQVDGGLPKLMNFMSRLRESTVASATVANLDIQQRGETGVMRFNLLLYTSRFASGDIFSLLPYLETPTILPPTPTVTNTPLPSATPTELPPSPTPTNTLPPSPTAVPSRTPTPLPPPATAIFTATPDLCVGAPVPLFAIGDTVVVDFNESTSLRVLTQPRVDTSVATTLMHVYDGERLSIVGGPVCGVWNGRKLWYWRVIARDHEGWVGAGTSTRWLCPLSDPECG